jgi:hypothetical protein
MAHIINPIISAIDPIIANAAEVGHPISIK